MSKLTRRTKVNKEHPSRPRVSEAPVAMTSNCILLINVNEFEGRDLEGRERFVGVAATEEEAQHLYEAADDAFASAASNVAAKLPLAKSARRRSRAAKAATS